MTTFRNKKKTAQKEKVFGPDIPRTSRGHSCGRPRTSPLCPRDKPRLSPCLHNGSPVCPRDKPSLCLGQSRGRRAAEEVYVLKIYLPSSLAAFDTLPTILEHVSKFCHDSIFLQPFLQFPIAVERGRTQKHANAGKRAQMSADASLQKSAKERFRIKLQTTKFNTTRFGNSQEFARDKDNAKNSPKKSSRPRLCRLRGVGCGVRLQESGARGPPQFLKKRSENAGANENLSGGFAALPGIAPRVAPRIVGFVLIKS